MTLHRNALIVGAVALSAVLAACGGSGSSTPSTSATSTGGSVEFVSTTPAATGDIDAVSWNLPYEPTSIDPAYSFNYAENTVDANLCESLLRLNPDFSITPALAESFSHPTPTTWVYKLRQGVTFWDGSPMTAADVVFSLKRGADPDVGSYFGTYFANVKDVVATDPSTVTVTLNGPDALFNQAMSTAAGAIVQEAFTKSAGKDFGSPSKGVMCTGPFAFGSWKSGDKLVVTRNADYWDAALKAKAATLTFRFISDETTAVNALRSGEIDGEFFYLPPAGINELRNSDTGTLYLGKSLVFWALVGASETGPYADPKVREGFSLAIDRPAVAKVVFQDTASPAKSLTDPAYFSYGAEVFQKAYDALPANNANFEEAKKLIAEAGGTSAGITIGVQGSSAVHEQTGSLLKAAGDALGVPVTIKTIPVDQYGALYSDPKAREGLDAFLTTWYGNVPDPLDVYGLFTKGGFNNFNNYTAVDSAVAEARAIDDPAARAAKVADIMTQVTKDSPWTPLEVLPVLAYMNNRVTGATVSSAYLYYPWAAGLGKAG